MMATHRLKTWPEPFEAIALGTKTFEFRRDDRSPPFGAGDWLNLVEWMPWPGPAGGGHFTGRLLAARVTYVARGPDFGIPEGSCVMSLAEITRYPRDRFEEYRCTPA